MNITNIDLQCSVDNFIANLSFRDPSASNPFIVKAISGLDAGEISSKYYATGNVTKNKLYSLTVANREIVIALVINPNYSEGQTISLLRDHIYKKVASSRSAIIQVRFKSGVNVVCGLDGLFKKVEADLFSDTPTLFLTLKCVDPWLKSPNPILLTTNLLSPTTPQIIDDISTAPHGFKFEATIQNNPATFVMDDSLFGDWTFEVTPGQNGLVSGFQAGDVIHFSSEVNNRYFFIMRGSTQIHLIDKIRPQSIWPIIFPGENVFFINPEATITWGLFTHTPTYWGI